MSVLAKKLQAPSAVTPSGNNPPFQKVALLLHGDGTNGAQNNTFVDYSYPGGYAVSFDGSGDYLTAPNNAAFGFGTGDFTIEGWIYWIAGSGENTFFCVDASSGANIFLNISGQWGIGRRAVAIDNNFGASPSKNTWNHIAVSRSGSTIRAFINGVQQFSGSNSANYATGLASIAFIPTASSNIFSGYISNLRVVKGTALYTSNFVPSNQPLTAVSGTSLLTCQSATIVDNSPNAFTITANGNAAAVSSKTITRTGNVAQGTFSPFSLPEGQWSNYFGASGTYLGISSNLTQLQFGTGDFTVECWLYPTNLGSSVASQQLIYVGQGASSFCFSVWNNNVHTAKADVADLFNFSSSSVVNNSWIHIAITRQSNSLRCFVNGTQAGTTQTDINNYSGTGSGSIGAYYQGSYPYFGYISNFRVVNGTAVYTSNFTPSTAPLTAISGTSLLTCQSNRFKDNSSNNFTITRNGDTKVTAFSPFAPSAAYSAATNGGSAYFDGSGDYLSVANTTGLDLSSGDFTIEGWFYCNTLTAGIQQLVNKDGVFGSAFPQYDVGISSSGKIIGDVGSGNSATYVQTFTGTTTISLNAWNHYAFTKSGTTIRLFLNGVLEASGTQSGSMVDGGKPLLLGYQTGQPAGQYLNGYQSNVRIVKGTALYTTNFTPPTAPLTAVANTQLLLNCTNAGIIDNAGKNDIETVGNAQVSTSVKKYGTGSMYFDGSGDYLKFLNTSETQFGTGDFTIEFWLYFVARGTNGSCLIGNYNSYTTGALAIFAGHGTGNTAKYQVSYNGASFPTIQSTTSISYNTWQHIALVRNAGTMTFYVDGVSNGSISATASINGVSNLWYVGAAGDALSNYYLNGYIDDIRITKGQALYTANFTPPTQAFPNI